MLRQMRDTSVVPSIDVDFGPEHILVVDDDAGVRRYVTRVLQSLGYSVRAHPDAIAALDEALQGEVAVALIDLHMPVRDGRWLLERLVSGTKDIVVIMFTGDTDLEPALECLRGGAAQYVTKPVATQDLAHAVDRAIEDRRMRLENQAHRDRLEKLVQERSAGLIEALRALEESQNEAIYRLAAAAEYRDAETGPHIVRVAQYAGVMAEELGLEEDFVSRLILSALMHDVGKIGISDAILQKPGKLSPEEFEVMKTHTVIGGRILSGSSYPLMLMAESIALTHHERWDGSGYPRGLKGTDIPIEGRIAALADVYDALTNKRVYKPAFPAETALAIIRSESGEHFDPDVVRAFTGRLDDIRGIIAHYGAGGQVDGHDMRPELPS